MLGVGRKLGLVLVFLSILPHGHQALSAPYRETTSAKQGCPTPVKPCSDQTGVIRVSRARQPSYRWFPRRTLLGSSVGLIAVAQSPSTSRVTTRVSANLCLWVLGESCQILVLV